MRQLITVFILMTWGINSYSQQYLYLKRPGEVPQKRLEINDALKIKMQDSPVWVSGKITSISSKSLTINEKVYPLSDITAMRTYNQMLRFGGSAFFIGGLMFTGIIFTNRVINDDEPLLRPGQIILGSSLIAGGGIMRWLSRKTYRSSDGWRFEVIDLDKEFTNE